MASKRTKTGKKLPPICARFGLTEKEIARRLDYFALSGPEVQKDIRDLHKLMDPMIDKIARDFYKHLKKFPVARRFLSSKGMIKHLLETLQDYMKSLGKNPSSFAYIESRLKVGIVHEEIGLEPKWYLGAYGYLGAVITGHLAAQMPDQPMAITRLVMTLNKILTFDASLGIDTYHQESMLTMEALLEQVREAEAELQEVARLDPLTQVFNRTAFLDLLKSEVERFHRYDRPLAMLFIDFDHFKQINDTQGHAFGDQVLIESVRIIRDSIRGPDFIGRYGGEELVLTLVECPEDEAIKIAERIRKNIAKHVFKKEDAGTTLNVTVSIGLYAPTQRQKKVETILRHADRAMYAAKAMGRNCVVLYEPGINKRVKVNAA